ncbi:type II toxin-antitoxin system RelE family toxin [Phyllobacterium chamaecytisi]|uniref:type II toxin-antitoxin system RelE family toxin n=1 Tax=Phyllobacterium chamaecytisi TaxID=2876082 RepID=UPI001CCA875E|nr:type II toxin-antitoxin system RelE/ParE family toxin [Phyllobacterium sp. KW56]MBZ9601758.1 type II toxin-antitoxin system RelE/ParE family toxin [Phyllobacterium sp. KW56]
MVWRIELSATATKQLSKLDRFEAKRISTYLRERVAVADDPRLLGKVLIGPLGGLWRYRVGNYRIVCDLQGRRFVVLVLEVGHRSDIYR